MAVNYVKIKNYKKFPDLHLKLDGRNTFFVGDIGAGKTCVLDLIMSANMQKEFPTDPLTNGQESGGVEIGEEFEGLEYIIKRNFSKKDNGRWTVTAKNGDKPPSLTVLLDRILSKTLKNGFFDYITYFFELKSPQARFDYMVKTCGGEEVVKNLSLTKTKVVKRRKIGADRAQQLAVYKQLGELTKEEVKEKSILYKEPKEQEEATIVYNKLIETKIPVEPLKINIGHVRVELNQKKGYTSRLIDIDLAIKKLQQEKTEIEVASKKIKSTLKDEVRLESEINELEIKNKEIEETADKAYEEEINNIITFNAKRKDFIDSITALRAYKKLDDEWKELDQAIIDLEKENTILFKKKLPIPELGVATRETEKEVIDIVTYNDREFSFENLSKGESIIIAAKIQNALNPGGNNFIVIPEANLLGSKLDDILEECKKFKIQALVEVTQRKQEFKIIFEEEFLKS